MDRLFHSAAFQPSRRALMTGAVASVLAPDAMVPARAAADRVPVFKVGTLPFGTVNWAIQILLDNKLDAANGIKVDGVPLASMEASRVAFLSGSVDTAVNDLLFAARLKAEGKPILFLPFSSTEGALMVAAASPIKTIGDLKGRSIGVGGGPLDKNWLLLRAAAQKDSGFDLTRDAHPVFGATPLLAAKVESGELDCGLLYWNYCARLQAKGYRQVTSIEDIAASLGAKGKVALGGFLFQESADPGTLRAFARAMHQTLHMMETSPEVWEKIRPLMQAPDEATFDDLKQAFLRGVPHKGRDEEIADTRSLYAIVAKLGGAALVGSATVLPADIYVDQAIYG